MCSRSMRQRENWRGGGKAGETVLVGELSRAAECVCVVHTKIEARQPGLHAEGTAEGLPAPGGCVNRGQRLTSIPGGTMGFAL